MLELPYLDGRRLCGVKRGLFFRTGLPNKYLGLAIPKGLSLVVEYHQVVTKKTAIEIVLCRKLVLRVARGNSAPIYFGDIDVHQFLLCPTNRMGRPRVPLVDVRSPIGANVGAHMPALCADHAQPERPDRRVIR